MEDVTTSKVATASTKLVHAHVIPSPNTPYMILNMCRSLTKPYVSGGVVFFWELFYHALQFTTASFFQLQT